MGKLINETPAVGATASIPSKTPTSEQLRIAQLLVDPKSEDHSVMKDKVSKVMELTRCNESTALVALHDCDNDVEQAVDKLLEGDHQGVWIVQEGRKSKKVQQTQSFPSNQPFSHQHQQVARDDHQDAVEDEDHGKKYDDFNDEHSKFISAPSYGRGSRGGGRVGDDFPPRFRGRGGSSIRGNRGKFEHDQDSGAVEGDSERGRWRGRGRGGRGDRGRGRGFSSRGGGRRGGEGGFDQKMDSWNAPEVESNTWDNSMANSCSTKGSRRRDQRKDPEDSNTWDNSMAETAGAVKTKPHRSNEWNSNTADDWGGEEDWSKLRDGLVIEQSGAKQNRNLATVSSSSHSAMPSSYAAVSASGNHVRGESIDVNMLFSNQLPPENQTSTTSQAMWSTKQATADLKNELGIGTIAPSTQVDSTGHLRQREVLPAKPSAIKVEMPCLDGRGAVGPIDVQFGDMTLGLSDTQLVFGFDTSATFKSQTTAVAPQHQEQPSTRQGQLASSANVFHRIQPTEHVNSPDLGSGDATAKIGSAAPTTYSMSGGYATTDQGHQSQQHDQRHFGSGAAAIRHLAAAQTGKSESSGLTGLTSSHQRAPVQVPVNDTPAPLSKDPVLGHAAEGTLNVGSSAYTTSTTVAYGLSACQATSRSPAGLVSSRPQATTSLSANPTITPYQQAMAAAGLSPYLNMYDQMNLNSVGFLPAQNLFLNAGGFDMRTLTQLPSVAGNTAPAASSDIKNSFIRQDTGTNFAAGATGIANLSVPPPGLPAPTVSNAEQAAHLLSMAGVYPPLSFLNPAAAPPYLAPQFLVPNVSSASAVTSGNHYQRTTGYPQPPIFNATGYEDVQLSSQDFIKSGYGTLPSVTQTKVVPSVGTGMALGDGNKGYAGGLKGAYDTKTFATATATPPPLGNMNFAAPFQTTAGANAAYGYPNYMPPVNMNMLASPMAAAMAPNVQLSTDILGSGTMSQRSVNQNPKTGMSSMAKPTGQYFQSWGN